MKKVIDKKIYDTETAKKIGDFHNMIDRSNFKHCEEELYVTEKGNYFLYGTGGPLSKYSVPTGNGKSGSSDIEALTEEEAIDWCERTDNVDTILEHFPDAVEEA